MPPRERLTSVWELTATKCPGTTRRTALSPALLRVMVRLTPPCTLSHGAAQVEDGSAEHSGAHARESRLGVKASRDERGMRNGKTSDLTSPGRVNLSATYGTQSLYESCNSSSSQGLPPKRQCVGPQVHTFKKIDIMPSIFSNQNEMKLGISSKEKSGIHK